MERQNAILDMVKKNGAVTCADLVAQFQVSMETIRRDLLILEQAGQLQRVHGGAVSTGNMQPMLDLQQRNRFHSAEKMSLSQTAAAYIQEEDILAVDSGSTAILFAQMLKSHFTKLTVVTYSMDVFEALCDWKDFRVILCGGDYRKEERAFCGALTLAQLEKLHVQKVFLFPTAVSLQSGICDFDQELYLLQKQLLLTGEEIFILADSSKFEKKSLLQLSPIRKDYIYITDENLPAEIARLYEENGIQISKGKLS